MAAAALSVSLGGCAPRRRASPRSYSAQAQASGGKEGKEKDRSQPSFNVKGSGGNSFTVEDARGRRLLEARVETVEGDVRLGKGLQGPVRMRRARCRLFQHGQPQIDLQTPEAVWDGKQLTTDKTAHGVTSDGKTVIDAQKAVWTADSAQLELENARLQAIKKGQTDFTATGPRAIVLNQVATLPSGAAAHNKEGQRLTADHVRWHLDTEKLEARGHVRVTEEGTEVSGQRLDADTKLKKGRMSGGARVHTTRITGVRHDK